MQLEAIIFALNSIIVSLWFIISYIWRNIIPLLLAAVLTLILREYIAWKVDSLKDRTQNCEKLLENVYGPLKSYLNLLIIDLGAQHVAMYEDDMPKFVEIFARYSHLINPKIKELFINFKKSNVGSLLEKGPASHHYRNIYIQIVELIELEYNFNTNNLESYRKMREGFWRNLWFHLNIFVFNERGFWGASKFYITCGHIREFIRKIRNSNNG